MSTQEVRDALNCIYIKAQAAGLCRDKKSFALFIKAPHTNVIQALNGDEKYLTQGMLNKAKVAMSDYEHGLSIGGDNTQSPINLGGQQKKFRITGARPRQSCQHTMPRNGWATFAWNNGVPMDVVSLALGHSFGLRVTQGYVAKSITNADDANRFVIDSLLYDSAATNRS